MKKISLIISTYNRPDALELVLCSVAKQSLSPIVNQHDIEVLIADDGSDSRTAELIERYKDKIPFDLIHVWHEDNGFRLAAIRNLAISKSTGEYVVFIDGDCIIPPDFLVNQLLLAEKSFFVGGNRVLLSQKYTNQIIKTHDISVVNLSLLGGLFARVVSNTNKFFHSMRFGFEAKWRYKNATNWRRPKGCNMALWREDLIAVNGFDESFVGWGHEDADFLIRLLHYGIRIKDGRFAVPVYHLWHKINDRGNEQKNIALVNKRLNDQNCIRASVGLDKY